MNSLRSSAFFGVKLLTLVAILMLNACSFIYGRYGETCNSRAYVHRPLPEYISQRFFKNAQVRMAIIPFSVPANLAAISDEQPGLGNELAWKVHAKLLESKEVPIVEVFNRQDWPRKKEEFFTGNFGALSMAQEAGYDLVMVGNVEQQKQLDTMIVHAKVIDVEAGITLWYGKVEAHTRRPNMESWADTFWLDDKIPSKLYSGSLIDEASRCIASVVTSDELAE